MTGVLTALMGWARAVTVAVALAVALATPAAAGDVRESDDRVDTASSSVPSETQADDQQRRDRTPLLVAAAALTPSLDVAPPTVQRELLRPAGTVDAVVIASMAFLVWFRRRGRRLHPSRDIGDSRATARTSWLPDHPVEPSHPGGRSSWASFRRPPGDAFNTNTHMEETS